MGAGPLWEVVARLLRRALRLDGKYKSSKTTFTPTLHRNRDDERDTESWMAHPSAFWLDPSRDYRASWPAAPTESDLLYDGSAADMALAYVVLTPEQRATLGRATARRISSRRNFDRYRGVPMRQGVARALRDGYSIGEARVLQDPAYAQRLYSQRP